MGLGRLLTRAAPAAAPELRPAVAVDPLARTAGSTLADIMLDFRSRYGFTPWQASTYRGFLSVPGAWRASVMLSDLFAQMPFHSYRGDVNSGLVMTARNAPILDAPAGGFEDPKVVMASWGMDYLWDGNMVGIYTAYQLGLPTAILPVPVSSVGIRVNPDPGPLGELTGRRQYDVNGVIFDQDQIFHVKGPCAPGALRGLGVLETQLDGLQLARDLELQANAISLHGVPTGILQTSNPEADPADLVAAKAAWILSQRTRTIAALGPSIEFKPLSWNPEELQLVEARKFELTQIELMFGLPVGWLGGATPSKTYSNVEQDAVNLVKFSALAGMVAKTESVFTRKTLPRGQLAVANLDAVLRSDTMNRYKAHQLATGNKAWKTPNEVRRDEGLDPIEGGDELASAPEPAPVNDGNTIDGEVVDNKAIEGPEGGAK